MQCNARLGSKASVCEAILAALQKDKNVEVVVRGEEESCQIGPGQQLTDGTGHKPTNALVNAHAGQTNGHMNGRTGLFDYSLRDSVDRMERGLAGALKAYRQQAEDVLEEHYEVMEHAQHRYDHAISLLRAENTQLRTLLGNKCPENSMAQKIMFQAMVPEAPRIDRKAAAKAARRAGDDCRQLPTLRSKWKGPDPNQQPGGTWQQFMAWVPNGAALQQPEPWKPLPSPPGQGHGQLPGQTHAHTKGSNDSKRGDDSLSETQRFSVDFEAVLPGSVRSTINGKDDDEDSEASSSETIIHTKKDQLVLVDIWKPTHRESRKMAGRSNTVCGSDEDSLATGDLEIDRQFSIAKAKPRCILDPDSNIRISWDLCSLFLVVYDIIVIPMMFFDLPDNTFFNIMDWTTRLFWTFDIAWSCCTGVVLDDGSVEYKTRFILRRYVKTWLPLDLFIVLSDWSGVVFQSGSMGLSKLARVSRINRSVRLLRLVRMQEILDSIMERIQNDKVILMLHVLKLTIFLIVVCHVMACAWWGIGDRDIDGQTWVRKSGYAADDIGLGYLASLHWALAQFGGGMEEVHPANGLERFFAIVTWVFAFMAGLIMLSYLTSMMTQQYIIGGAGARQLATLKKYLNQNKVPKNLVKRVCRNAKHAISGDLTPDVVDLLHVVSEPLHVEMHYELYSRCLASHPFFMELLHSAPHLMRQVCHLSMSTLWLAGGDVVFSKGEEPVEPKMFFVMSGSLKYLDKYGEQAQVTEKMYLAEGVLWTSWTHVGTLTATNAVKLALLDAISFQDICAKYMRKAKKTRLRLKCYARDWLNEVNSQQHHSDITF